MPRDVIVLLEDIHKAIKEIEDFLIQVKDLKEYEIDILRKRAVERN